MLEVADEVGLIDLEAVVVVAAAPTLFPEIGPL